ncbi:MAG: hypothetical protein AB2693_21150, partial [Candidatus Thiodiazotropha sp.]
MLENQFLSFDTWNQFSLLGKMCNSQGIYQSANFCFLLSLSLIFGFCLDCLQLLLLAETTVHVKWLPAETVHVVLLPVEVLAGSRIAWTALAGSHSSCTVVSAGSKNLQTVSAEA